MRVSWRAFMSGKKCRKGQRGSACGCSGHWMLVKYQNTEYKRDVTRVSEFCTSTRKMRAERSAGEMHAWEDLDPEKCLLCRLLPFRLT